jgi:hypothetical protein
MTMSDPIDPPGPPIRIDPPSRTDPTGQVFVPADDGPLESSVPAEPEERRGALRTATVVSARVVLGFITVGVLAVVVAAAILLPLPSVRVSPVSTVVTPVPTVQQLVCPGGLLRLASASGKGATTASAIGAPRVVSAAEPGSVRESALAASDAGTAGGPAAPRLLSVSPVGAGMAPPLVSGAQSEAVATDEFFGLSAAGCTAPSASTWLAGGSTTVGRTTLLLLANPTEVASVVSLQIFGETGQISAPGMDGIAVAAGAQRVLSLAGFAPNVASPVVHVFSTGGQVVASLEQTTVRGLAPGGVDFVGGTAAPTRTTVLPGVVVTGSATMAAVQGQSGFQDLETALRIYLPSTRQTTASVTILAEDGSVTGTPIKADLQPGTVTDFPLDQLSDGNYTAIVTSKVPVVASIRVSTADGDAVSTSGSDASGDAASTSGSDASGGTDFAWVSAAPLLTSSVLVPIAPGMSASVHLENPTGAPERVVLSAPSGGSITTVVGAHKAASVAVDAGTTYRMTGFGELYASVSGVAAGQITSYTISPIEPGEGPVRVYG